MVLCFAAGCKHQTVKNECSFFRFPKDKKLRTSWTNMARRADKNPTNDSRLCSCHFKDGKKENGPTIFFYREGKQFDFPDPEKRFKRKVLSNLEGTPNPDGSPPLKLEQYMSDSARKLRKIKHKNIQNCPCCDNYTPCNVIHKKYKRNYHEKKIIKDDKTSSEDKIVNIVKIKDGMVTSSSNISDSNSNSGGFHLVPVIIGNSTIYLTSPIISTQAVPLAANSYGNTPLTITNYAPSTTLTPANILSKTENFVNSPLIQTIKVKSEETVPENFESVQENDLNENVQENDLHENVQENDLHESVPENDLHESDVDSVENESSDSELNISSASEQINSVTHAEAFCATQTLLNYMMNQDDINNTDINFILTLAQKIKKRLSIKEEDITENL